MDVEQFIAKWWGSPGGQEKSNFAVFIPDLCGLLGVERPGTSEAGKLGTYEYEGSVPHGSFRSLKGPGAIDLYKRGHFICEAKQSYIKPLAPSLDLGELPATRAPSGARYDALMRDARAQAENYARYLPADHPPAPFLIVCDIGRAFEIYVDTAGNGRGYTFFPDKHSYRIELPNLRNSEVLDRLRSIWTDPRKIDPRFAAAQVTRRVAANLATVSQYVEDLVKRRAIRDKLTTRQKADEQEASALFVMRLLFCMFAEDIGLLPDDRFKDFLKRAEANGDLFETGLSDLWHKMGAANLAPRFAWAVETEVRYFNGGLFESRRTWPLSTMAIHDLYEAARHNWSRVEPAIFGTLLEQALSEADRSKLGAHYTPRKYVEVLVRATIMDVLEPEWAAIESGDPETLIDDAHAFHDRLATFRVLDPACGTGNFLYVAMELLQALEARVIETIQQLGGEAEPRIGPHQFHGLEKNINAAKIAELVLWIGWLRNRLKDNPDAVPEPVLAQSASINFGRPGGYDAVLALNETGQPDFENPRRPEWPEADFIVGNPPFIGGKDIRDRLGSAYAEALWQANADVPKSADFVMQWWNRAAELLTRPGSPLRRFGFVTTNSITQVFSRRVIERHLAPPPNAAGEAGRGSDGGKLHLVLAIPDHPWTRVTKDAAAVRIAMTVAQAGTGEGRLVRITGERALDTDAPELDEAVQTGAVNADLSVGVDVTRVVPLKANQGLCSPGVKLHGAGFIVTPQQARDLGLGTRPGLEAHIRDYRNGRDLLQRPRGVMVIDLFGLSEREVRQRFPEVYQHILIAVKPERDLNRRAYRRDNWWLFGENNPRARLAWAGLSRCIVTPETSKHRVFQFVSETILNDNANWVVASDCGAHLGVLQSFPSLCWILEAGGTLEDRPKFTKTDCFDPFPFPALATEQFLEISRIAEELDETRRTACGENPSLTITGIYNFVASIRASTLLPEQEAAAIKARARIVAKLHDDLDLAVADAYGWGDEWRRAPLPPSEIVARLVRLNAQRADEEAQGHVRWLRPEYQLPRFAKPSA